MRKRYVPLLVVVGATLIGLVSLLPVSAAEPGPVPNGFRFIQAGTFSVEDRDGIPFWTTFEETGGIERWGYPISRRFVRDGFTYQAFQRGLMQWRPDMGKVVPANSMEQLTAAGRDNDLHVLGIPRPILDDGSNGDFEKAKDIREGWLTDQAIRSYYLTNPATGRPWSFDAAMEMYGLPASFPEQFGPFKAQRFQRGSLQLWTASVPNMPAVGTVVAALAGDLQKQFGLLPAEALVPEDQTGTSPAPTPTQAPSQDSGLVYGTAAVTGTHSNCGVTDIRGRIEDANGNGVSGVAIRVRTTDGGFETLSNLSVNGDWEVVLAPRAQAGDWLVWVDINGQRQSPIVNVQTNGEDKCGPGSGGVQTVFLLFKQGGATAAPAPTATAQPTPTQSAGGVQYPNSQVTAVFNNCGVTDFQGFIQSGGSGVSGVTVRVRQVSGGSFNQLSPPSRDDGFWELVAANEAKAGEWQIYVEINGQRQSPIVNAKTDGPEKCQPDSGGVQSVKINFTK